MTNISFLSEMPPYFIFMLTILTLVIYRKYVVNKWLMDLIIILFFTIFAGIKVPFTADLFHYIELYNRSEINILFIEPIFILIKNIGNFFHFNYHFLFIVYQMLTISFILYGIKLFFPKSNFLFGFSIFLYISIPFLFLSSYGVEIRQLLAISIMFVALYYLANNSYKRFYILSLLAFLTHYTSIVIAIISLFAYIINKKIENKKQVILSLLIINIIVFILSLFFPNVFDLLIKNSLNLMVDTKYLGYFLGISPVPILKLLIYNTMSIVILFLLYKKISLFNNSIYYAICFFSLGVILFDILSNHNSSTRIVYYYFIFQIIFIPYILKIFKDKQIVFSLIILFYLSQYIYGLLYISPFGDRVFLPYKGFYVDLFDIKVKETQ